MKKLLPILIALLLLPAVANAQQWSSVITNANRAYSWETLSGLPPSYPLSGVTTANAWTPPAGWTQCGSTYAPDGGTIGSPIAATALNAVIAGCAQKTYVKLGCGTPPCAYAYNTSINQKPYVYLDLGGPTDQVIVYFVYTSAGGVGINYGPSASQIIETVTSGAGPGATNLTLSALGGIATGEQVVVEQCDTGFSVQNPCSTAGNPPVTGTKMDTGDSPDFICSSAAIYCSNQPAGGGSNIQFGSLQSIQLVTCTGSGCFAGATASSIVISPGLKSLNWNQAQGIRIVEQATTFGAFVHGGTVDFTHSTGMAAPVNFVHCYGCGLIGTRLIGNGGATTVVGMSSVNRCLIMSNDIYVKLKATDPTTSIGIEPGNSLGNDVQDNLIFNNKVLGTVIEFDGPAIGDALIYNFLGNGWSNSNTTNQTHQASNAYFHVAEIEYELMEGNELGGMEGDDVHGTHCCFTFYRNLSSGWDTPFLTPNFDDFADGMFSFNRFANSIGNVLGTSGITTSFENSPFGKPAVGSCGTSGQPVYQIGLQTNGPNDPYGYNGAFRWGDVTVCDSAGRFDSSKVPSGLTNTVGQQLALSGSGTGPYTATFTCSSGQQCIYGTEIFSYGATGTVTTSGTSVTYVSGTQFNTSWTGSIKINGTNYTISSVASATSLTLTTSAGTQSSVAYSYNVSSGQDTGLNGTTWSDPNVTSGSFNNTTGVMSLNFTRTPGGTIYANVLQTTTGVSPYAVSVPGSHTIPLSALFTNLQVGSSGTNFPVGKFCTSYNVAAATCSTYKTFPMPGNGPDTVGGSTFFGIGPSGFGNDIPAFQVWLNAPVDPNYQQPYSITASCFASNCSPAAPANTEQITVSGFPGSVKWPFQISTTNTSSGVIACPNQTYSSPNNVCYTVASVNFSGSGPYVENISYSASSDPGSLVGDFLLVSPVRYLNADVMYLPDTSSGTPTFTPSPTNLNCGPVYNTQSFACGTITGTVSGSVTFTSVAISGTNASDFTMSSNTCTGTISSNCATHITFAPTAIGAESATLTYTDNASGSPQTVSLSGTGVNVINNLPLSLSFGNVFVTTTSPELNVIVTNQGSTSVTSLAGSVTGANPSLFTIDTTSGTIGGATNCATLSTLTASSTCAFGVTFKPLVVGSFNAGLSIAGSNTGSPEVIPMTGSGINIAGLTQGTGFLIPANPR